MQLVFAAFIKYMPVWSAATAAASIVGVTLAYLWVSCWRMVAFLLRHRKELLIQISAAVPPSPTSLRPSQILAVTLPPMSGIASTPLCLHPTSPTLSAIYLWVLPALSPSQCRHTYGACHVPADRCRGSFGPRPPFLTNLSDQSFWAFGGGQGPTVAAGLPFDWHAPPRAPGKKHTEVIFPGDLSPRSSGLDILRHSLIQVGRALGLEDASDTSSVDQPSSPPS